ncbi:MAG TPA: tetratricopeptide repeat protein [Steroidobacteraceae bacterium]|nr:tetratricopeptide repeat protein [Steroidobacteraceae bacterium]
MARTNRKIAAILAADVVGYSRLMGADDEGTLVALKARRAIFDRLVVEFDGREFGSVGDSLMAQFASAVNAVRCAQAIQRAIGEANASVPAARRMALRIGVNLGDVIEEEGALFGDGVNVAARLQSLAEAGGILVSGSVYEQVRGKVDARFTFVGTREVKNIAEPVRAYEVSDPIVAHLGQQITAFVTRPIVLSAIVYVTISSLAVWMLQRFAPAIGAPAWTQPALITLLAAGFVPAMVVAWRYERSRPAHAWVGFAAASTAIVVCCAIAWSAWVGHFERAAQAAITRPAPKALPVVAVGALQNLTGDPQLDWLSEGVANLVRDGLAESRHVVVVSPRRWQAVLRSIDSATAQPGDVLAAAERAGIDYVVSGEYLRVPEGLLLTARLSDVESGIEINAYSSASNLDVSSMLGEAGRLVVLTKQGLKVPHTENVASFSADFAVNNMAAYEAYLGGLQYFLGFNYQSAERAFRSALALAPDFQMARYRLAQVQVTSGDTEGGLATLDQIPADAPLTPRERAYVDGARALFTRDAGRAKGIYETLLTELPFDVEAHTLLAQSYDVAFEDEAAATELKRLLDQEPQNDYLWSYLGETYLRMGQYDQARQALDRYLALKPRDPYGFTILGQLEQLTGKPAEAAAQFRHALELEKGFVPARLALAQTEALLEDWPESQRLLNDLVADTSVVAAYRIDAAFDLSALLRAEGRFASALEPLRKLEPELRKESIREAMALAERGLAQAELGHFGEADRLIDLATARSPGVPTRYLFARGMVMLMRNDVARARAVANEIRNLPVPSDNPQDAAIVKEAALKAATYLEGLADLRAGDAAKSAEVLARAVALPGYQYSIYKLGLARALLATGQRTEALKLARAAASERDPGDLRLDLELDRSRAVLLEAEILAQLGQPAQATARARAFLRRWHGADPGQEDRLRAERLANTGRADAKEA